jgi:hypothetical protein
LENGEKPTIIGGEFLKEVDGGNIEVNRRRTRQRRRRRE